MQCCRHLQRRNQVVRLGNADRRGGGGVRGYEGRMGVSSFDEERGSNVGLEGWASIDVARRNRKEASCSRCQKRSGWYSQNRSGGSLLVLVVGRGSSRCVCVKSTHGM